MPILVGTDGTMKMSKSLGNYVAVEEPPNDMYGKLMSLPDDLILAYFEYLTDVPEDDLSAMARDLPSSTVNPMALKKRLAWQITQQFHDRKAADGAQAHFEQVVQGRGLPDEMREVALVAFANDAGDNGPPRWSRFLVDLELADTTSEAKRLINQRAVEIIKQSGESITVATDTLATDSAPGDVVKVGKRRLVRLVDR